VQEKKEHTAVQRTNFYNWYAWQVERRKCQDKVTFELEAEAVRDDLEPLQIRPVFSDVTQLITQGRVSLVLNYAKVQEERTTAREGMVEDKAFMESTLCELASVADNIGNSYCYDKSTAWEEYRDAKIDVKRVEVQEAQTGVIYAGAGEKHGQRELVRRVMQLKAPG
jgi:H2-forming N5,N10-methylenetetrahydromethanopterin dehydrogenase-like enzyme